MTRFARIPVPALSAAIALFLRSAVLFFIAVLPLQAQERVALIIGNAAYQNVPELKNPRHDSEDLATALRDVGFEVSLQTDLSQAAMLDALRGFRRSAQGADVSLIYFAGHGIEIDRKNYLLPVDAVLESDADINFEAVPLDTMLFAASGAARLNMVIVDACRNNPFKASMQRSNANRSVGRGLIAVEPTKNTLVAYAAKEGTTAADGVGRNSPYAAALIKSLKAPKVEVGLMMRQVRDDVLASTAGRQEPFVYGSLSAEKIYLNDPDRTSNAPEFVLLDEGVQDVPDTNAGEIVFWKSISDEFAVEELNTYLRLYPDGFFVELARARIKRAGGQVLTPVPPATAVTPEAPAPDARALTRAETVELQERLSVLGHSLGRADGIAGKRTLTAISGFERSADLPELGVPSLAILAVLREKVTDAQLANWRAAQVVRAKPAKAKPRTKAPVKAAPRAKAAAAPKATAPPKVAAPPKAAAPAPTVVKKAKPKNSKKYSQFCAANQQCATRTCRRGSQGDFFSNARNCRFCMQYVERCQ